EVHLARPGRAGVCDRGRVGHRVALVPYTTLFRSGDPVDGHRLVGRAAADGGVAAVAAVAGHPVVGARRRGGVAGRGGHAVDQGQVGRAAWRGGVDRWVVGEGGGGRGGGDGGQDRV